MKLEISRDDYEFLKGLQHELNTQTTDGNAQPVFWGVSEIFEELRDGDYCGEPYIGYDDGKSTLKWGKKVLGQFNDIICKSIGDLSIKLKLLNRTEQLIDTLKNYHKVLSKRFSKCQK